MKKPFLSLLLIICISLYAGIVFGSEEIDKARDAMKLGMYERALKILNARLEEKPNDIEAHMTVAECHMTMRDYPAAGASFERILAIRPDYTRQVGMAYYSAADRAIQNNRATDAKMLFDKTLANDPGLRSKMAGKYMIIGNQLLGQGDINNALAAYDREMEINPRANKKAIADKVFNKGRSLIGGNDNKADKLFSYAAGINPGYGKKAEQARADYGEDVLNSARNATGKEREKLKEKALKYVSKERVDKVVPPPAWKQVGEVKTFKGQGMSEKDPCINIAKIGDELKKGYKLIVTGEIMSVREDGWKTYEKEYSIINTGRLQGKFVEVKAPKNQEMKMEIEKYE